MTVDPSKRRRSIGLALGTAGAHNELLATIWLLRQGYEVLRNVSPHGMVDIVGIKNGEIFLFDVKAKRPKANGEKVCRVRLSEAQIRMGIRGLAVFPDGACEIDHNPFCSVIQTLRICPSCQVEFMVSKNDQIYCKHACRPSAIKAAAMRDAR